MKGGVQPRKGSSRLEASTVKKYQPAMEDISPSMGEIWGDEHDGVLRTYVCFFQLKNKDLGVAQYREEDMTLVMGSVWNNDENPLSRLDREMTVRPEDRAQLHRTRTELDSTVCRLLVQLRPNVVVSSLLPTAHLKIVPSDQMILSEIIEEYKRGSSNTQHKETLHLELEKKRFASLGCCLCYQYLRLSFCSTAIIGDEACELQR